ncbi:MAG: homocysteine S-methyltransferase family protein [Chloroflexota bacterium]
MLNILSALDNGELIIGDGAMGTMLQAKGLPAGAPPESWNREHPEVLREIHTAYLEAGAQIATTNTFGGNRLRLRDGGLEDDLVTLNRLGVELAQEAVGDEAWVAASVGPTGKLMEPFGPLSISEAEDVYAEQIAILAEAGADLVLMETAHDIDEACCAIRAAKAETDLPVFATFAFNAKGRTMMGLKPDDAAQQAEEAGADIVGANCGEGPQAIRAALEGMKDATTLPLMAQSNAGLPREESSETVWDITPEEMAEHARLFVSLGARIVGGCCGTGPEHIAHIASALRG